MDKMKYMALILTFIIIVLLIGCESGTVPPPTFQIYRIEAANPIQNNCSVTYPFDLWSGADTSYYYWIGVFDKDDNYLGGGSWRKLPGTFSAERFTIDIAYYMNLEPGIYKFKALATRAEALIGNLDFVAGESEIVPIEITTTYNAATYENCKSNGCSGEDGRYYAQYYQSNKSNGIVGVKARITSRLGNLCVENETKMSTAHISISFQSPAFFYAPVFVQCGFTKEKKPSWDSVLSYIYFEYWNRPGGGYDKYNYNSDSLFPVDGEDHEYALYLEKTTGVWKIFIDNLVDLDHTFDTELLSSWINHPGDKFLFGGEIINFEDDMPGTVEEPCYFRECAYFRPTDTWFQECYFDYGTYGRTVSFDRNDQWFIEVTGDDELSLYDLDPL